MACEAYIPAHTVWLEGNGGVRILTRDDDTKFTALVQRQSRFVFRVAYAVLLNSHDAEDAVQETFLKLYRNGGWRNLSNERAFLARVAWRVAVDRRSPRQETVSFDSDPSIVPGGETLSPDPGPEQTLIFSDQNAHIHALIDALPEELRLPLVFSASAELNSREIGRILGVPEGTVRTRLQRARQLLRQKLGAAGQPHLRVPRVKEAPYA